MASARVSTARCTAQAFLPAACSRSAARNKYHVSPRERPFSFGQCSSLLHQPSPPPFPSVARQARRGRRPITTTAPLHPSSSSSHPALWQCHCRHAPCSPLRSSSTSLRLPPDGTETASRLLICLLPVCLSARIPLASHTHCTASGLAHTASTDTGRPTGLPAISALHGSIPIPTRIQFFLFRRRLLF